MADPEIRDAPAPVAFDDVFRRRYSELFALSFRLLGDRQEAEDMVQEAFFRLASSPVLLQSEAAICAWLRRVCLNDGFNRTRQQRRERERLERAARLDGDSREGVPSPPAQLLRQEVRSEVRKALDHLPDRQRECLILRHSGYSYAEIATTVGIAPGSVGVFLARAERAFREEYQEEKSPT